MSNLKKVLIGIVVVTFLLYGYFEWFQIRSISLTTKENFNPQTNIVYQRKNYILYKGVEGKDALALLKEKAKIEQNSSGLVVLINGRKADDSKNEFWAFYVNGKMAPVGPTEYKTKNGDLIEWKIEKY